MGLWAEGSDWEHSLRAQGGRSILETQILVWGNQFFLGGGPITGSSYWI